MNSAQNIRADSHARVHIGDKYSIDAYDFTGPSRNRCLADLRLADPREEKIRIEQTKGGLFRDSYKWILDNVEFSRWRYDKNSRLLWIKGDAGKGKTMLLCGIIDELSQCSGLSAEMNQGKQGVERVLSKLSYRLKRLSSPLRRSGLLLFFFCQATDSRLNTALAVLRGLIYLLLLQKPALFTHVQEGYEHGGRGIFEGSNAFYSVSHMLLRMLRDPLASGAYLVIDALDECEDGLPLLLDFILSTSKSCNVKWIVSSRSRHDVEQRLQLGDARTRLSLELNTEHITQAVNYYIDYKISNLVLLNGNASLRTQVSNAILSKSDGTFLWAALVLQELECVQSWNMMRVLQEMPSGLVPLYNRMVKQIEQLKSDDKEVCRLLLTTITLAYRPLHLHELGVLSHLPQNIINDIRSMEKAVDCCGSFLTVRNNYVYLVHQSGKDYLMSRAPKIIFNTGLETIHFAMFSRSIEILSTTLRRDVYSLGDFGITVKEVTPPAMDLLSAVQYSCLHWVDHLYESVSCELSTQHDDLVDKVDVFLRNQYLHWLEALSLAQEMPRGVLAVEKLDSLIQDIATGSQLNHLVRDMWRFILTHRYVIESAPLQAYASAMVFSPTRSLTRQMFQKEEPKWLINKPPVEEDWNACLTTFEGHSDSVSAVVFSPDGQQIASASWDNTVKLWDARTGACFATFEGHNDSVSSVVFSPDGRQLASASWDNSVKLWDANTGACLTTFEGHNDSVSSVVFSPDGRQLASASWDNSVKLWDANTGACLTTFDGHSDSVSSVAFSLDGQQIASASKDHTIKLWNVKMGVCLTTFEGHSNSVTSVIFTPDGMQLLSISDDETVKLWDAIIGICLTTFEGYSSTISWINFSPDGQQIVSAMRDKTVRLYTITGACVAIFEGHSDNINFVTFSPGGKQVASASIDETIKLWDTRMARIATFEEPNDWESLFALSRDSQQVAPVLIDKTVRRSDVRIHDYLATFGNHSSSVRLIAFSTDGKRLASASWDKTIKLWDASIGVCLQTIHTDLPFSRLSFNDAGICLDTDNGPIILKSSAVSVSELQNLRDCGYGVSNDGVWITHNTKNILWLPSAYRPSHGCWAAKSSTVGIGCPSGRVWFVKCSTDISLVYSC